MIRRTYATLLCLALFGHSALAQVTTGAISGTVRDGTGGVLPGVTVTVRHLDTGAVRVAITDGNGAYRAPNLSLGAYEVAAELTGFKAEVRRGIELTIARAAVVDLTLAVGEISESVVVTSEAALVETTSSSVAGLVSEKAIRALPLSGRDFVQLALLEPSVLRVTNTESDISKGFGTRTTFAGSRPRQNTFLMDGTNVNALTNFGVPGSVAGVILGVDTVREFQVLVGSYSAEYAGAGGTLNAVTKSGTNQVHGTSFWLTRTDKLDEKNYFDVEEPDFSRNQFGLTAGGPIRRDRLFFLVSYEGLRDRRGLTQIGIVPDANARNGLVPDPANPGQLRNVGVHPNIRPYLDLNPMPNGRTFGDGLAEYIWSVKEPTNQNYMVGKIDYQYRQANSMFVRYTIDDSNSLQANDLPLWEQQGLNQNQWLTVENRAVLSDRTFFLLRFGYARTRVRGEDVVGRGQSFDESLKLVPDGEFMGQVSFVPSPSSNNPRRTNITNSLQYTAQLALERGRHSWKLGGDLTHYLYNIDNMSSAAGVYTFTSLTNFLLNRPSRVAVRVSDVTPGREIRMLVGGLFLQDDLRLTSRLTLNAGVRYEPYSVPWEANGLESVLVNRLDPAYTVGAAVFDNPSWRNFGPRVGFAWDVTGNGRVAVRGGGGLYHDILLPVIYRNSFANSPPYSKVVQIDNPISFPNIAADLRLPERPVLVNPDGIQHDLSQPRLYHANLQVEAQLTSTLVVSVGYIGNRGHNQVVMLDGHTAVADVLPDGTRFIPAGRGRRNPNFAGSWWRMTDGESFYHGFRAKVTKRFSTGTMFGVSYSAGRAIDDSSTDAGQTDFQSNASLPQDPDNRKAHRGLSNFDARHNLTAHFSVDVPWGNDLGGAGKALLAGWQINGIVSLASGTPFTPLIGFDNAKNLSRAFSQRPSLTPGYSNNPVLGGPDQYFDPMAFQLPPAGTYGNVGRNTIIGPGMALVDLSMVKQVPVFGGRLLEFRAEAFNLLNRVNFARPNASVFNAAGRVGSAGRITSTSTPARQIQLGLRLSF